MTPAPRPRFLVLNELYHPCWQATVDGTETPIFPTNVFMRGVTLPPGAARVEFVFRPFVSRPVAFAVYGLALVLLGMGALFFNSRGNVLP